MVEFLLKYLKKKKYFRFSFKEKLIYLFYKTLRFFLMKKDLINKFYALFNFILLLQKYLVIRLILK